MSLVRCHADAEAAAAACGQAILQYLDAAVAEHGSATLAISGGTSPKMMFQYFLHSTRDWSLVHIYWVDERCVPVDDPRSNYKLAHDAWLGPAGVPEANVHRVRTELGAKQAALLYDVELNTVGAFDVIHRGMGSDGHTASLFPGDARIGDRQGFASTVAGVPPRITMLRRALEGARHTCVLATGADKRAMLDQVLHAPFDPMKFPAQIAALDPATAVWFVDKAAHPC